MRLLLRTRFLALLATLVFLIHPSALAHDSTTGSTDVSPNPGCLPWQNPHDYVTTSGLLDGTGLPTTKLRSTDWYVAWDGNEQDCNGDLERGEFDGEHEYGVGGGFFPYGPWAEAHICDYGIVSHHSWHYRVESVEPPGIDVVFWVGADPTPPQYVESFDPDDDDGYDCVWDGAVSPDSDPDDWVQRCVRDCWVVHPSAGAGGGDGGFHVAIDSESPTKRGHIYSDV